MKATFPALSRPAARLIVGGLALAVLIAGCGASARLLAQTAPTPAPVPQTVRTAPTEDWRDRPVTPGNWHWTPASDVSSALYRAPAGTVLAALTCDLRSRRIWLRVPAAGGPDIPVAVTTTGLQRLLSARSESGSGGMAGVALDARDPLLDAMAFSRGRFMIEAPGSQPLYLPSWTEISRVIEDCR